MTANSSFAPETAHDAYLATLKQPLAFNPSRNYGEWRKEVRAALVRIIGANPERVDPAMRIEKEESRDGFLDRRFVFSSEAGADVPCHLLVPAGKKGPFPVMVCLQGHTTGMHLSVGIVKYARDEVSIEGGRDFGIQAVKRGYAALIIEQRCFGERVDMRNGPHQDPACTQASMASFLLGRTMVGERIWDVSRALDLLPRFPETDPSRVGIMGNSGGGTITFYAACVEERIKAAMPSCSWCPYADSILRIDHCPDNFLPGALSLFDIPDLSCLVAPRPMLIVAGAKDDIFLIDGVRRGFEKAKAIYAAAGAPGKVDLVVGGEGHRFYPAESWPVFDKLAGLIQL